MSTPRAAWLAQPLDDSVVARMLQPIAIMTMFEPAEHEILGRIAYIDPSRQWGFLHGPHGERVYFHAADVTRSITELAPGAQVCYRTIDGDRQPCAVQIVRCEGRS